MKDLLCNRSKMSLCKIYIGIIVCYLIATTHEFPTLKNEENGQHIAADIQRELREEIKILVVDTNMPNKKQQEARDLLEEILNNHVDKNFCKQYALGFVELHRNTKWGCFRFPANDKGAILEGSYYTESSEYLEVAVTIEDAPNPKEVTHYLLFNVRKW